MALSGSYDWKLNANEIVTQALLNINAIAVEETPTNDEMIDGRRSLNGMMKAWQAEGIGLWLNKEIILFIQADDIDYSLGPSGDNCALVSNSIKTELAAAAASGASSLTIDATTGFGDTYDRDAIVTAVTMGAAGDITLSGTLVTSSVAYLSSVRKILIYAAGNNSGKTFAVTGTSSTGISQSESITGPNAGTVYSTYEYATITGITISAASAGDIEIGCVGERVGIELDAGTIQWTNIGAALSTTLVLITTLTSVAAIDNHIYSYTAKAQRPLEIIEARRIDENNNETPLYIASRNEYMSISNKTSEGTINQIYYDGQLTNGVLYVWPEPDNMKDRIKMTVKYPIQDFDAATNDADFPQEWFEALIYNLALRLSIKYGKTINPVLGDLAIISKNIVSGFDREDTSIYIQPDYRGY